MARTTLITAFLMILLGIKFMVYAGEGMLSGNLILLLLSVAFILSLKGVYMKKRWWSIAAAMTGGFDAIMAFMLFSVGSASAGTAAFDAAIILLAYKEYGNLK